MTCLAYIIIIIRTYFPSRIYWSTRYRYDQASLCTISIPCQSVANLNLKEMYFYCVFFLTTTIVFRTLAASQQGYVIFSAIHA
jgi:hypothetical protein